MYISHIMSFKCSQFHNFASCVYNVDKRKRTHVFFIRWVISSMLWHVQAFESIFHCYTYTKPHPSPSPLHLLYSLFAPQNTRKHTDSYMVFHGNNHANKNVNLENTTQQLHFGSGSCGIDIDTIHDSYPLVAHSCTRCHIICIPSMLLLFRFGI